MTCTCGQPATYRVKGHAPKSGKGHDLCRRCWRAQLDSLRAKKLQERDIGPFPSFRALCAAIRGEVLPALVTFVLAGLWLLLVSGCEDSARAHEAQGPAVMLDVPGSFEAVGIVRDGTRGVTCWVYGRGGISCLPDSALDGGSR